MMNNTQQKAKQRDNRAVSEIIQSLSKKDGALLPILHAIQNARGYIPKELIPMIADALHQTSAEIHGVISFYHHFRTTPPGKHVVQICRAEACQSRGSRSLENHAKETLNVSYYTTTADREFTLEPVYCLGNCACGPSIRVNDDVIAEVTPKKFDAIVSKLTTHVVELN